MLTIVLGTNPHYGGLPLLLRQDEAAPAGSFRWRTVAQTDDESIAAEIMQMMYRRCYGAGEPLDVGLEKHRLALGEQPGYSFPRRFSRLPTQTIRESRPLSHKAKAVNSRPVGRCAPGGWSRRLITIPPAALNRKYASPRAMTSIHRMSQPSTAPALTPRGQSVLRGSGPRPTPAEIAVDARRAG